VVETKDIYFWINLWRSTNDSEIGFKKIIENFYHALFFHHRISFNYLPYSLIEKIIRRITGESFTNSNNNKRRCDKRKYIIRNSKIKHIGSPEALYVLICMCNDSYLKINESIVEMVKQKSKKISNNESDEESDEDLSEESDEDLSEDLSDDSSDDTSDDSNDDSTDDSSDDSNDDSNDDSSDDSNEESNINMIRFFEIMLKLNLDTQYLIMNFVYGVRKFEIGNKGIIREIYARYFFNLDYSHGKN
jgi:hypothetical protein